MCVQKISLVIKNALYYFLSQKEINRKPLKNKQAQISTQPYNKTKQLNKMQEQYQMDEQLDEVYQTLPKSASRRISQFQQLNLKYSYSGISNASSNNQFILTTARSFNDQFIKLTFVEAQKLYSDTITKIITELQKRMLIHEDLILYLLFQYNWNQEKLEENYYDKHFVHYQFMNQQLKTFIQQITTLERGKNQQCQVCLKQDSLLGNGFCQHKFCSSCWSQYIRESLLENKIFFECMSGSCNKSPVLLTFVQQISPKLIDLYHKKICMKYAGGSKTLSYCPSETCLYFCQKPLMIQQNYIECVCGTRYCFKCQKQPHQPAICQQVEKWEQITAKEQINSQWIAKYTKKCPKCKQFVQKSIGCNHMTCVCGMEFCFNCLEAWNEKHRKNPQICLTTSNIHITIQEQNSKNMLNQTQNLSKLNQSKQLSSSKNLDKKQPQTKDRAFISQTQSSLHSSNKSSQTKIQAPTQIQFNQITDKIIYISLCRNKDDEKIKKVINNLMGEDLHILKEILEEIKTKVYQAWLKLKWTLILIYLKGKKTLEIQLEKDLVREIRDLVKCVESVKRKNYFLSVDHKQQQEIKEQLLAKEKILTKTLDVWLDAYKNHLQ